MAWLFKRPKSPFWYIGYRKASGKPPESTRLRWDDPAQTREARDRLRQANADERSPKFDRQRFVVWVPPWLSLRYGKQPANLKSYTNRWRALESFLSSRKVFYPAELTGEHAWQYVIWRTGLKKREGGIRKASKNTALHELSALRMLMRHAIAVGYASRNPLEGLRIPRDEQKEKPEIDPQDLPRIMDALSKAPAWMGTMFRIAYWTGCRLNESRLPMRHVDLDRKEIHFPEPKGHKPFTVPIAPTLIPLLTALKAEGRQFAFDPDCSMRNTSARWIHFFRKLHMPYSFHVLRVDFISRCIRAGLQESVVQRLVNHAGPEINRRYQRHRSEDLRTAVDSIPGQLPDGIETQGGKESTP